jgi:hypothetical protein
MLKSLFRWIASLWDNLTNISVSLTDEDLDQMGQFNVPLGTSERILSKEEKDSLSAESLHADWVHKALEITTVNCLVGCGSTTELSRLLAGNNPVWICPKCFPRYYNWTSNSDRTSN